MKIRIISSKGEIETLKNKEQIVHLSFRPSSKDVFSVVEKCPNLKALHIPDSYKKDLPDSILMYFPMQSIDLLGGGIWGHRKDINGHLNISKSVFDRINSLKAEGLSDEKIVDKMDKETKLGSDFIDFIMKKD